ncbi:biotin-dependent carboxyltransferase family protein [Marivirga harenae]|uniref:5-oxoprolinase subunit C family protein n=1 Tax=Marivirga harenae TaxID=2010992 RepID=UPI0026E0EF8E|nr:biotin-dependent carboxyltransferase family protein [Marivirga harenae]WKV11654.1 biotin-dependent carboxyltransferase family protein [Marivirga harenae]
MKQSELTLIFLKAGMQTTVQDQGRAGLQHLGVPIGGALDKRSAELANYLVGNNQQTPVLEITMMGPEILFDTDALVAVTGAQFDIYIDNRIVKNEEAFHVKSGTIVRFGQLNYGCRAYMAVAGKWNAKKWKGSASPILQAAEATPDSIIKKGSKLKIESAHLNKNGTLDKNTSTPPLANKIRLKVKAGPEFENISRTAIAKFFGQGHLITQDANRMGYRLKTELTALEEKKEMISSGIIPGTVQLTSSGQPIILLNDAQTTGGYPRIVNIIAKDLDQIAQLKPGDEIWFSLE